MGTPWSPDCTCTVFLTKSCSWNPTEASPFRHQYLLLSLSYSFNHPQKAYYLPGTVIDMGDVTVNKKPVDTMQLRGGLWSHNGLYSKPFEWLLVALQFVSCVIWADQEAAILSGNLGEIDTLIHPLFRAPVISKWQDSHKTSKALIIVSFPPACLELRGGAKLFC